MQTQCSDENSVCPSVRPSVCLSICPSVKHVLCDKIEERSVQIFLLYERSFSLVSWEEEWLVGDDPFSLKFWVTWSPLERNADFQPIFARISSAVTPSEKSLINPNRKSTTRSSCTILLEINK